MRVFERAGFGQVVTPTFEDTALFSRTSGDASDVVSKEMYSFRDRGDRELTLRPEGTAPVVRAYLEHGLAREPQPVKLWYVAPMFRYARAQRGRYREHWQFGVESLGSDDPAVDAEVIALQAAWFGELGLLDGLELQLNSIGDPACRPAYRSAARGLSRALPQRALRGLAWRGSTSTRCASSTPRTRAIRGSSSGAPRITDHLCEDCAEHFASVRAFLDARGVAYVVTPELVRGLDYYERTAWEWVLPGGGSQAGSISGGGRYDGLARADRRRARARRRLRLRHRARRARTRGSRRRARRLRVVDWFCACEDDERAAGRCTRCSSRPARAGCPPRPTSPDAASRASCVTPSGCARAWSRSAAPATASVASSGTERPRSPSAMSSTTSSGACGTREHLQGHAVR